MAGLTISGASGILKDAYMPNVREQLNNKVFLLSQLEANSDDVEMGEDGAEAVMSLHVQRTSGIANIGDGGTLPAPGNQTYTKARVPLRTITGRIRFTVQTMEAMSTNAGAWERAATSETKRITSDLRRDVNRQLAGTADGTICVADGNSSSTTIQLTGATYVQLEQLEVGMIIDVSSTATPGDQARAASRTITAVDRSAKTITISGAAIVPAANDRIERAGNGGAYSGTSQRELTGLQKIVAATGTLQSVDSASYPVWKSYVDNPGGAARTPTENLLEKAMHSVDRAGDGEIKLWLTEHGVERAYSSQLVTQKRFANTMDLKGGYKGLSVSTGTSAAALVSDRDVPANSAFGVDPEHLAVKQWTPLKWLEEEGGTVLRQTPDQLAYEGTAYWIVDLLTDARNSHAFLGNLASA